MISKLEVTITDTRKNLESQKKAAQEKSQEGENKGKIIEDLQKKLKEYEDLNKQLKDEVNALKKDVENLNKAVKQTETNNRELVKILQQRDADIAKKAQELEKVGREFSESKDSMGKEIETLKKASRDKDNALKGREQEIVGLKS